MKEEAVDILFFFLQNINRDSLYKNIMAEKCKKRTARIWKVAWIEDFWNSANEFELIVVLLESTFRKMCLNFVGKLVSFYKSIGMTEKDVYKIYFDKWQKNMKRIKGEWTR